MERKQKYPPDNSNKPFPARLTKLTKERGGQSNLAKAIGKTRQMINHYCNGKYQPDSDTLVLIANHYGVSVDWLLGIDGVPMEVNIDKRVAMQYTGLSEKSVDMLAQFNKSTSKKQINAIDTILSSAEADFLVSRLSDYFETYTRPSDTVQVIHGDGKETEICDYKYLRLGSVDISESTARYALLKIIGTTVGLIGESLPVEPTCRQTGSHIITDKAPEDFVFLTDDSYNSDIENDTSER